MSPRIQKRKNLAESKTNANNSQSESRKCPVSASRQSNTNSTKISYHRRNLRSSKVPVETGTASFSRCSQPHISRGHASAPDDIQQLDVPSQTINSACQVRDKGSDKMKSPSRYLVSDPVAHPPILEPEMGQKEAENGESSTVGEQEMMEEKDEAENSLSNHSNVIVGQNTFEEQSIPMVEEVTNKNHMKCIPTTGCSAPAFSLKLTEMIAMAGEDGDDEVDSEIQSQPEDNVNGYQVKPELMEILRKIIGKRGDIAKNCTSELVRCRSTLLEVICEIISELEKKNVTNIKETYLTEKIAEVDQIKKLNVEVDWLHARLTEILEVRGIFKQSGTLKAKMVNNKKFIEIAESALEECEAQKKKLKAILDQEALWKERLAKSQDESTKTSQEIRSAKSKVSRFLNSSLVDDLL